MRAWRPFSGRTRRPDPLEFSASTNFYEYANNNPVDFSDPTGTQPAPGGVGFGAGGGGGGGGGLGGFADYNNYGAGASSDMAIQSDSPTQPVGVHGVGVGLVLPRQFSVGQSAGGDLRSVLVLAANRGGGGHGKWGKDDPAFGNKEEIDRLQRELDELIEKKDFGRRMSKLKARLHNLRQRKSKKAPESNKMIMVPPTGLEPAPAIEPPEPVFEPELIPAPTF